MVGCIFSLLRNLNRLYLFFNYFTKAALVTCGKIAKSGSNRMGEAARASIFIDYNSKRLSEVSRMLKSSMGLLLPFARTKQGSGVSIKMTAVCQNVKKIANRLDKQVG